MFVSFLFCFCLCFEREGIKLGGFRGEEDLGGIEVWEKYNENKLYGKKFNRSLNNNNNKFKNGIQKGHEKSLNFSNSFSSEHRLASTLFKCAGRESYLSFKFSMGFLVFLVSIRFQTQILTILYLNSGEKMISRGPF